MMDDRQPISRAVSLMHGTEDANDLAWLRRGFAVAFAEGISLEEALGLPPTPARRREAMRDHWLERAAAACTEIEPWAKACELARAGRVFESRVWPKWRRASAPPNSAADLEIALYWLYCAGGRVPMERRVFDLLEEFTATNRKDIAVDPALTCIPT